MTRELEYRALLAVDIERSGGRGNVALEQIREVLGTALRASFDRAGIDWTDCVRDDLGDGFRVIAPPGLAKSALVHPLVHELAVRLRAHNRNAGPGSTVRVRVALHAGEVRVDGSGVVTGGPLEVLARLLDAPPLRAALADAGAGVSTALLVSQHFHDETVRHGYPGIDPDTFHEITFTTKEHTATAWLHLAPDAAFVQRGTDPAPTVASAVPVEATAAARQVNKASGHGTVFATQHGTQNIHTGRP